MADIDLNSDGVEQAHATAARLKEAEIVAVYSSDLKRAVDTAEPIAALHGVEVKLDPRFREIDQGEWTGVPVDEIEMRWPHLWGSARHYTARPGGESPAEVRARALEGVEQIVREHPQGTVVLVSHGGTIRWISAEALGLDDRGSARIRGLGNGGVVSIEASLNGDRLVLGDLKRLDGSTVSIDDPND